MQIGVARRSCGPRL